MPLVAGQLFAGYTVLRLVGSGGMGEVYLAQHPRLPRRDALKVLPEALTDNNFRERFNREADLAATLWHPHVVGVHDRGEDQGRLWLSMDFVEGTDAGELLRDWYPSGMPVHEVCAIVTAVAGALDHVHQRGLLHRDVKPANILLTHPEGAERRILLADFGIARQLADVGGLTATNVTVGTVFYAAPEQLMGAEIDGRADQYALAATAFHLLTGSPMYQDTNPVAIISQHLNAEPPKLSERRPDLAHLDQAFFTALAKDPRNRYDGCRQFATALGAHVIAAPSRSGGAKPAIRSVADIATVPETQRSRRRGRLAVVAGSAIVICALLGLCGQIAWQQREQHRAEEFSKAASQGVVTMTSLDFKKAKLDVQRVLDSSTGAFRTAFERRAADFTAALERSLVVTESTVKDTTVESMNNDSAVVLVAAKSEVTDSAGAQHEPLWWRVSVTVARDGDQLKMSKVEFVPQSSRFANRAD